MRRIILIILLSMSYVVNADTISNKYFQPFTTQDKILQGTFTIVTLYDLLQTKEFRGEDRKELNPILGETPSQERVDTLIIGGIVIHGLVTYMLPIKYRVYWQMFFIGAELSTVARNHWIGVRLKTNW